MLNDKLHAELLMWKMLHYIIGYYIEYYNFVGFYFVVSNYNKIIILKNLQTVLKYHIKGKLLS